MEDIVTDNPKITEIVIEPLIKLGLNFPRLILSNEDPLYNIGLLDWFKAEEEEDNQFSIYRVPEIVRKFNSAAYEPRAISLGLYEFDEKDSYLKDLFGRRFIKRNSTKSFVMTLPDLLKENDEVSVYTCYENPAAQQDDCLRLLVPSAIFIIEYLRNSFHPDLSGKVEYEQPLFQSKKIHINHDLLLLENQIPYFFLQLIFNHFYPSSPSTFNDLVMSFFHKYNLNGTVLDFTSVMHFTDLIRTFHKPTSIIDDPTTIHEPNRKTDDPESLNRCPDSELTASATQLASGVVFKKVSGKCLLDVIRRTIHKWKKQTKDPRYPDSEFTASATQLHASGVKFKKASEIRCLLDVKFKKNILELPRFELNEDQESLYRNLMAFELCHYPGKTFIIDYFVFMDTLINTADDISLLVEAGVLVNRIGDYHNAANTFNKFCAGITNYDVGNSYLKPVYAKLNAYYNRPENTWITTFKRDYFGTPLKIVTTVTAIFLVVLTFISTVCSVISVV